MWMEWVGRKLGRYSIEAVLGQGGMGVVLRAHDAELLRTVAIKVLYPHLAADTEVLKRFRREAQAAAALRHRSIVAVHDVGQEQGCYYLVMEYVDGQPLSRIIEERGPLPVAEVLAVTGQIAAALDYIHRCGLVHRDVKTANIIVERGGRAVLTDFGLVRALVGGDVTSSRGILGTPQYLAPERIAGGELGPWTDLYGLGVVVYEMLTGQVPFDAEATSALLLQVLWETPPPARAARPALPEGVDQVLGRILAKQPRDRYPSGAAFLDALGHALLGAGSDRAVGAVSPSGPQVQPGAEGRGPLLARARQLPGPRFYWPLPSWLWAVLGGILVFLVVGALLLVGTEVLRRSFGPTGGVPAAAETAVRPLSSEPTVPSVEPSPSLLATGVPTATPSHRPATRTATPTSPSPSATPAPATTPAPVVIPTAVPTRMPTPTSSPTPAPTSLPTPTPTASPTPSPEEPVPTSEPTKVPATEVPPTRTPPPMPTETPPSLPRPSPTKTPPPGP